MSEKTNEEILHGMKEIFTDDFNSFETPEITIEENSEDKVVIEISKMYDYVTMNLSHLLQISRFFGTDYIDDKRYSIGGCETCDFGSSYTITLTIRF